MDNKNNAATAETRYIFSYGRYDHIGIFIFFVLFFIVIAIYAQLERALFEIVRDIIEGLGMQRIGARGVTDILMFAIFVLSVFMSWIIVFNVTKRKCTIVMYGSHMKIDLGTNEHVIQYRHIKSVFSGSTSIHTLGGTTRIDLKNGNVIKIPFSFRFKIRHMIIRSRFVKDLEKRVSIS